MEGYSLAIREGLRNFRRIRTLSLALAGCVAVSVFVIGAFGLLAVNVNSLLEKWESRVELVAFLDHGTQVDLALAAIVATPLVGEARLIEGREAWEKFFSDTGAPLDLSGIAIEEVLSAAVIVKMAQGNRDLESLRGLASRIGRIEGVEEVKYEKLLLDRYMRFRSDLAAFTVGTSIFWILVFGIISASIARLASAARNEEVQTLSALGAGRKFIRRVFMVEGIAQGLAGSTVGILVLLATANFISARMGGGLQLPARLFVMALVVGPMLGLMSSWFLVRRALAAVFMALVVLMPMQVEAQTGNDLEGEIARHRSELILLEERLKESRTKSEELSRKEIAVIDELEKIDREVDALSWEIEKGERNIVVNRAASKKAEIDLGETQRDLTESRKDLGGWLKLLSNQREPTMVEVILGDIPQSEITLRREVLSRLARKGAEALKKNELLRSDFEERKRQLDGRLELDVLYTEKARLRARRSVENKERREVVLGRLRDRKNIYAAVIKDLDASARRLENLMEDQAQESTGIFADSVPFREMKGLLFGPTDGEITVGYGRIKNPGSNTYTRHRGLDFVASAGMPIRAVHDAKVVYSDWFRGYGKLIILSHGGGYNTVYAHCSKIFAKKGDLVRAGQKIALVGETGSLKGPFLYFEVRENGKPVDPAPWLQRRSLHATQSK
jgi:septal ring factor EnvC (AmiA/AmiB activator)